jgi:hypothetical protein
MTFSYKIEKMRIHSVVGEISGQEVEGRQNFQKLKKLSTGHLSPDYPIPRSSPSQVFPNDCRNSLAQNCTRQR